MKPFATMSTDKINERIRELTAILNMGMSEEWDKAYAEYSTLTAVLDERYREENRERFEAYYSEHIEGKSLSEIDPEVWDFYSDWHKDMYGFRPRHA